MIVTRGLGRPARGAIVALGLVLSAPAGVSVSRPAQAAQSFEVSPSSLALVSHHYPRFGAQVVGQAYSRYGAFAEAAFVSVGRTKFVVSHGVLPLCFDVYPTATHVEATFVSAHTVDVTGEHISVLTNATKARVADVAAATLNMRAVSTSTGANVETETLDALTSRL